MKRKYLYDKKWAHFTHAEHKTITIDKNGKKGILSLAKIDEVERALIVKDHEGEKIVSLDGYYWIELAFEDENIWMTSMFDEYGNFLQSYFDITFRNVIDDNPYLEDAYLDMVIEDENHITVLDMDELLITYKRNSISLNDTLNTLKTGYRLYREIAENTSSYINLAIKCFKKMKELDIEPNKVY